MGWKQVILIVSALATVVLLYILPTPNANYRVIEAVSEDNSSAKLTGSEKVQKALKMLEDGSPPMQAIQLLKQVEADEPENQEALFYLGDFSLKTGQFDKAIPRLKKLTELIPSSPQYWYMLGQAYEMNKQNTEAIAAYETFITFATDSIINEDVKQRIEKLK